MIRLSNLGTRVIVALIGIPLILAACIIGKIPFLIFAFGIGIISFAELSKMLEVKQHHLNRRIGELSVTAIIFNTYFQIIEFEKLALIIVAVLMLAELFRNRGSAVSNLGSTLIGIFYVGLFASSLIMLREFYSESFFTYDQGGYLIISVFVSIWLCDSAAYFVGTAIGTHKMLPRVSPNKSWEGAIAGFVFSVIGMLAARFLVLDFLTLTDAAAIGIIVGTFGQAGDFIESMIKRDANVKDSSSIIPGHGGIFDRFDSLIFSAPIIYLYLELLSK
jgi:phosphatidate cytidylyltransferase